MQAENVIYTWDYHHGQATRIIAGGLPPLRGATMIEKQTYFAAHCDHIRASLMQEPRGHRNMLGAVLTEPVTADGDVGVLFLHPRGFFEMCGDSTFSIAAMLIDAGIINSEANDECLIRLDTVAGRVEVMVTVRGSQPVAITFDNVPSYSLGTQSLNVIGVGSVEAMLGYGGLTYAFVEARAVGLSSLKNANRDEVLDIGTRVLVAGREQTGLPSYVGPDRLGEARPVGLITLWEPLESECGARVANFYAPGTMGRTPSGTGLSARVAIEAAAGRLEPGETFVHESLLGLRFSACSVKGSVPQHGGSLAGVVPSVTARSFLMGTSQWILNPDDPFRHGFIF